MYVGYNKPKNLKWGKHLRCPRLEHHIDVMTACVLWIGGLKGLEGGRSTFLPVTLILLRCVGLQILLCMYLTAYYAHAIAADAAFESDMCIRLYQHIPH